MATWWTGPSQQRLFSSVSIGEGNYHRWMDSVVLSGPKAHLLGYVRSLLHFPLPDFEVLRMRDLAQDSGGYLSALRNLRSLNLHGARIECIGEEEFRICFSAFRETLTTLILENFHTSFSAFVTLVDYFPNITSLALRSLRLGPDKEPVPSLSRPFRGKIRIHDYQADHLEFFNRFAGLDPEYEEVTIGTCYRPMETKLLESILRMSTSTVKFLRLAGGLRGE